MLLFQFNSMNDCPKDLLEPTRELIRRLAGTTPDPSEYLRMKE